MIFTIRKTPNQPRHFFADNMLLDISTASHSDRPIQMLIKQTRPTTTLHWAAFTKPLLQWKINNNYILVFLCALACVCVGVGAQALACACARLTLLIQHATRMRHIVCASLAPPRFSTLSHKRHDFRENFTGHKMCVLIFSTTFIWGISHSKTNSAR